MLRTVIFDMDGVIIDSEPLWREAERSVLTDFGFVISDDEFYQTWGLRTDEVVQYHLTKNPQFADQAQKAADAIDQEVIRLVLLSGEALPGVADTMEFLRQRNIPIGLATSSSYPIIDAVLKRCNLRHFFKVIYSAQEEPFGKPHPGVYIGAAKRLGADPRTTTAIEDTVNGMIAAKAARLQVIVVPAPDQFSDPRWVLANHKLASLTAFQGVLGPQF